MPARPAPPPAACARVSAETPTHIPRRGRGSGILAVFVKSESSSSISVNSETLPRAIFVGNANFVPICADVARVRGPFSRPPTFPRKRPDPPAPRPPPEAPRFRGNVPPAPRAATRFSPNLDMPPGTMLDCGPKSGCSADGLAYLLGVQGVGGSTPPSPIFFRLNGLFARAAAPPHSCAQLLRWQARRTSLPPSSSVPARNSSRSPGPLLHALGRCAMPIR